MHVGRGGPRRRPGAQPTPRCGGRAQVQALGPALQPGGPPRTRPPPWHRPDQQGGPRRAWARGWRPRGRRPPGDPGVA
eukprot:195029-Alexandrium_andersonii.AAC.1